MKVLNRVMDKANKIRNAGHTIVRKVRDSEDRAETPYNTIGRQDWERHTKQTETLGLTRGEVLSL
jgi:hypothetical protein